MKPHRRKDTPPRREPAEGNAEQPEASGEVPQGEVPHEPVPHEIAPEQEVAYQAPEEMQYDPAQALVDPEASYPDPHQAPEDPAQVYVDPVTPPPEIVSQPASPATHQQGAAPVPRRKVVTKRAGGSRRPSTGRPGTRYKKPQPNYGGGVTVMGVFLFLVAIAMLGLVVFVIVPKDVSHVKGYPVNPMMEKKDQRNLLDEAQKIMVDRTKDLVISEAEVNAYLNHRIQGEQDGIMASLVKFRGVYVDFSPGMAEFIVEREFIGMPITLTSRITAEKFQRRVLYRSGGWSIGKLEFSSRNIKPIISMFLRIRTTCQEEFSVLKQMGDVRFEEDKVVLDATI